MLIYALHAVFWGPYLLRAVRDRARGAAPEKTAAHAAPGARQLVYLHSAGLFVLYFGLGAALGAGSSPSAVQMGVAATLVLAATGATCWTLAVFRSWRLVAVLGADHQLSTDGPFRWVRNPIYAVIDVLALATWIWAPTPLVGLGVLLTALGGDLRARAEERLLTEAFGDRYRAYARAVKRFVPGIY